MNAAELIEQIKKLPREEQEKVLAFLKSVAETGTLHDETTVHYMDAQKAKNVSSEIFSERAELFRKLAK
jgi:mRNA-degrading endonuclease RelE of RelBE toxin-antitoxin system